ncbi:MAG: non-heme iron oxygenase ferredoxin subunit [Chloroflexi bacterium]|nr:MAG: non-heme iron oxygenase ferredoxin subunit [Chloroflexota bacterium]
MWLKKKQTPDADGYYDTAVALADIQPGQITCVKINGEGVILVCWEGKVHAFSNLCPHAAADLAQGELSRWKIECPDHGYCFDVRTGRILWPEDEMYRLKQYPVRTQNGRVYIKL